MDIVKWVLIGAGVILGIFGAFLLYFTAVDYNPPQVVNLKVEGTAADRIPKVLTLMSWNIGYAGLGKGMDFFMDGGERVRASEEETKRYLMGILKFVKTAKGKVDVFFFQEVDVDSDRSYHINEYAALKKVLTGYASTFAFNYHVDFVPVPIESPMGKVRSGIAVFSRMMFRDPKRIALPGEYPWPTKIFHLDRCMIVVRIPAPKGKEWVLINTHNSAYDTGDLRKVQLAFIKKFILREYEKGNYVVIGGDWNAILSRELSFRSKEKPQEFYIPLPKDWTPRGWHWAIDPSVPTNRSLSKPYVPGENFVTIIDGFLLSPNVRLVRVKGINLGFRFSDHNPVIVTVEALH